jgi:hypothetical protein
MEWTPGQARSKERALERMIEQVLQSSGVVAQDSRIDDRDIPTAPNYFTWVTDTAFARTPSFTPWAKQIEHPTRLFNEWCPNPKCTDRKWWANVPVDASIEDFQDRVTFLEFGVCPRCHTTKSELVAEETFNPYNELAGLAGQRASKTFQVMLQVTYDLHRLLKSQNPQAMFNIAGSQQLQATFVALTFAQAKENLWDPLTNMLNDFPWFQQYHAMLDQTGRRIGVELYNLKDTYLRYRHRNLLYTPSGPNKKTSRGRTRVSAAVDEIGHMNMGLTKGGKAYDRMDAEEVYISLERSLTTVRDAAYKALIAGNNNIPMGYFYNISSPASQKDMIMKLHEQSRGSKTMYGYRAATWEINPTISRDSPIIVEAYRKNPVTAARDYAAIPPVSGSPFLMLSALKNTFHGKTGNDATLETRVFKNKSGGLQTTGKVKFHREYNGGPCGVFIDAGSVNNSFAVAVVEKCGEKGNKARVRFAAELILSKDAPAHFPSIIRNVVQPLIQHYSASVLCADRWQSIQLLQQMEEEEGITPLTHSLKYPEFEQFRQSAIYDNFMRLPALEVKPKEAMRLARQPGYPIPFAGKPIAHLLYQLVGVQDLPGVTVSKPEGATDDLFRAIVLGWHITTDPELAEHFATYSQGTRRAILGVVARGREGSTGVVSNAMGAKRSYGTGGSSSSSQGGGSLGMVRRAAA